MKKIFRCFSLLLISAFLLSVFTYNPVSANYEASKNKVSIVADRVTQGETKYLKLHITVTYQRGFATHGNLDGGEPYAAYMICPTTDADVVTKPENCTNPQVNWTNFVEDGSASDYISKAPAANADLKPTKKTFEVTTPLVLDSTGREDHYIVFVQTFFCAVRKVEEGGTGFNACQYWHDVSNEENGQFTVLKFKVGDVLNNDISKIEDKEVNEMMSKIVGIVNDTVLPIIYIALGLFLVVKGSILGVQIVKSADEPQVRQEKIGSLKWLVIGVAVAYAASGIVNFVTNYFKGVFGLK